MRAAAVRRLAPTENHDLLVDVARADADPQVRRAAVRKLGEPAIVVELARSDEDEGVREAALDTLAGHRARIQRGGGRSRRRPRSIIPGTCPLSPATP